MGEVKIYKYVSENRVSILKDGLIRFSQPQAFNDPFELRPHVSDISDDSYLDEVFEEQFDEMLKEEYSKLPEPLRNLIPFSEFKNSPLLNRNIAKENLKLITKQAIPLVRKELYGGFENNIGILSLTKTPENLLMWAHYANSHQGFILEFDINHPFFNRKKSETDEFRHLREVTYSVKRPSASLSNMDFELFLVKSEEWAYEKEWRLMLPLNDADKVISCEPHDIHLYQLPFSAIKSVILGHRSTDKTKNAVIEALTNESNKSHISLHQASIDEREFKLNFHKVNI